ncbi:hypothetical protein VCSRO147_0625 [Vibrio cholerae]|nr:hypothetical protein VCSRO147_0625 [Vibrio cholerae]
MKNLSIEQASIKFPVGAKVKYFPIRGIDKCEECEVRSDPWMVCGETVIKVSGRAGCVSVNHLKPINQPLKTKNPT